MKITKEEGTTKISNPACIQDLLEKFNMDKCAPKKQPANPHVIFRKTPQDDPPHECPYRELIGALLHLQGTCRPDITQAVNNLSRYMNEPSKEHWTGAKHVLAYLKGTTDLGIIFRKSPRLRSLSPLSKLRATTISLYTDSDYAMSTTDRKSTTGCLIYLNQDLIDWCSSKQDVTTRSSCEAEHVAADSGARKAMFLRKVLAEITTLAAGNVKSTDQITHGAKDVQWNTSEPTMLHTDSQSAIAVTERNNFTGSLKHIETRYYYLAEQVERKKISLHHIPGVENPADLMTKAVKPEVWKRLIHHLVH